MFESHLTQLLNMRNINVQAAFLYSFMYDFRHQKNLVAPLPVQQLQLQTTNRKSPTTLVFIPIWIAIYVQWLS